MRIPEDDQDKALVLKLREELPGILAWCVDGCEQWKEMGLAPPAEVMTATELYRDEQDPVSRFLKEACVLDPGQRTSTHALHLAYRNWAAESGEEDISPTLLARRLRERGFTPVERIRDGGRARRGFKGIGVRMSEREAP